MTALTLLDLVGFLVESDGRHIKAGAQNLFSCISEIILKQVILQISRRTETTAKPAVGNTLIEATAGLMGAIVPS